MARTGPFDRVPFDPRVFDCGEIGNKTRDYKSPTYVLARPGGRNPSR